MEDQNLREFSAIIVLRKYNNWIKSVLINKYVNLLQCKVKLSIFDLCAGKGGDLNKWARVRPAHYVALEYQESLINKSIQRMMENKSIRYPCIFIVADAGDENTTIDKILSSDECKNIKSKVVFDIVSCQFSMHYLYEKEAKLRAFLHNVTCRLEPGGFFIGTTVDAERVVARIRTEGKEKLCIGNKFYSIQFGQEFYDKAESPYGLKFYFYLKDAVGRERASEGSRPVYVPEYLVSMAHFE